MDLKYFSRYSKLFKIAFESLSNAFRLHYDSFILYQNRSYSTSFVLSVLALEEFGKFLIYNDLAWHKSVGEGAVPAGNLEMYKKYLKESLSSHTRKIQHVISWHLGPMLKKGLEKKLEKLSSERLSALYVGVNPKNGHVILPKKFSKLKAKSQIKLMNNKILLECAIEVKRKNWHFDTDEMNNLIKKNFKKLQKISEKLN